MQGSIAEQNVAESSQHRALLHTSDMSCSLSFTHETPQGSKNVQDTNTGLSSSNVSYNLCKMR